jgi:hypothetical protein
VYLLLLTLLAGGGIFFAGNYFFGNKARESAPLSNKEAISQSATTVNTALVSTTIPVTDVNPGTRQLDNTLNQTVPRVNAVTTSNNSADAEMDKNKDLASGRSITVKSKSKNKVRVTPAVSTGNDETGIVSVPDNDKAGNKNNGNLLNPVPGLNKATTQPDQPGQKNKMDDINKDKNNTSLANKDVVKTATGPSPEKKKDRHSILDNLGITFSAGAGVSFVELKHPGKVTTGYGAGLSYTFAKKKLSVQAGIQVNRALYASDSAGYHPPGSFWAYYPNMQNIEADCKILEIPVAVKYHFGAKKNHNWYAGTGISSYLMKKETYDYQYKSNAGQAYYKSYTLENKNKHYLSVLTLSGGYQADINRHISVSAEPYIKIPLQGVGFGKVKLKTTGVLFTATVRPFAKKK